MRDIEERDDLSDSDEEMTDMQHQIGRADSFRLIAKRQGGSNLFNNSLTKIISESSNTQNSNHLMGGGLLGFVNSARSGSLLDVQTPTGITESPIFGATLQTRFQNGP